MKIDTRREGEEREKETAEYTINVRNFISLLVMIYKIKIKYKL